MANDIDDGVESQEDTEDVTVDDNDDVEALKEKFEKISEQNRQLFARAKKAEGFELKEGKWVKSAKADTKPKKVDTELPKETSKPSDLDYGQKAFLKAYGISGSDELALVKQFQERGFELDGIVGDDVFTAKLNNLREAKASQDAIPKAKKRSGAPVADGVDEAVAKYKETGELPKDFATRSKVVNAITAEESGDMFSGPSVVGGYSQKE